MKTKDMKRTIERAVDRKAKSPCITAVVLANYGTLRMSPVIEICRELGLPESYKHQIRAILQVPEELEALGFQISKRN